MFKFFSIVGTTAVGKTDFALAVAREVLAKKTHYQGVDLISADSRQVYRGLEVMTGADVPASFQRVAPQAETDLTYPYFINQPLRWHGTALIEANEEWSVAHFHRLVWEVLKLAFAQERLVLVVGGTGLYHQQIMNFDPALQVGPNARVRKKVEQMSVQALQDWARQVNPKRFSQLNRSDRYNPRRLVRVIEIGLADVGPTTRAAWTQEVEQVYLGLADELTAIERRIQTRVEKRLEEGALQEVKRLVNRTDLPLDSALPALSTLGFESLVAYLEDQLDWATAIERWTLHEFQYARHQLQWWQNNAEIEWFKLSEPGWKRAAFAYILETC